jgi:hypothetical protein
MMISATAKNRLPHAALCAQSKRNPLRMVLLDPRKELLSFARIYERDLDDLKSFFNPAWRSAERGGHSLRANDEGRFYQRIAITSGKSCSLSAW